MHRLVEENGVLDVCRELGIGFVPYSPINRGFLGGCINEYTVFDVNNDNRQTLPRFQPEAMRANTHIVNALQAFGRTRGMTSAQVALGWLLQKAPWIVPIPGTTKLSHLEENLRTLDFNISSGDWKELEDTVAAIPVVGDRYNAEQQRQVFQPEAMRANTRIVNALQTFGRTRGMTSAQVALGWLLQKAPWIVPIPGTTKLSHLEENLRTLDFNISSEEWKELEDTVAAMPVVGDRYNAEQQRQVGR
ncbi:tat (Twin-arginine translocation) pathway signal sequence [Bacteroides sp. CAG:189]|nr:tat (Twin-arginine translocation) pathway signal sequence [Bacteroides sp. CAG:189]